MNILVTGGAGFIGSNLCKRLITLGHSVQVLDNYFTGLTSNHVKSVTYINGSTVDISTLVTDIPDTIFHLGEYSRVEQSFKDVDKVLEYNKIGTQEVVKFATNNKCKLIYAGSSTKYGENGENSSPYAWSKSSNTQLVKNYGAWFGLDYAITYFYNVYGNGENEVGEYATLIGIFKNKYMSRDKLTVVEPGTQVRNFTHIDDTIDGLILVLERGSGDSFGIASDEAFTVLEVAEMFNTEIVKIPGREGNRMSADVVTSRTKALGWLPKRSLKDYIETLIEGEQK